MAYTVYMHTCPNGKKYIGITANKTWERWKNGNGYNSQSYFYNAINKYGWENIKHEILFNNLTKEEAEIKEIELIAKYKSNNRNFGYNIYNGGSCNSKLPQDVKDKISMALKGREKSKESIEKQRQKLTGRKWSEETRKKIMEARSKVVRVYTEEYRSAISLRVSGKNHHMYGKHHTAETRAKMSNTRKGEKHKPMTQETKEKLSIAKTKPIKVYQYTKTNELVCEFNNLKEIRDKYKYDTNAIMRCAKGKTHTSYGYLWKFESEV